jgi:hypothetical protein
MTTPKHKTVRASQRRLPGMQCGMPADLEDSTGLQVAPYHTGGPGLGFTDGCALVGDPRMHNNPRSAVGNADGV